MARSRPLRALGRSRLHPPVRRAPPDRLRPDDGRPEGVPAVGSRTPGHPEWRHTPGVNVTTGPLGQGVGNSVGMAIAEEMLAARYNRPGHEVVNHRTFAICSDGDMMEGVSGEASSIAGFLGLGKLCLIYDDNHITIEGSTDLAFGEDVPARYEAYGWHVQYLDDGWTLDTLRDALAQADAETDRPSFIALRTHIAWGAPHAQDTAKAHGAPLGEEEVRLTKQVYGWDPDKHFYVPDGVYEAMDQRPRGARGISRLARSASRVPRGAPRARGRVRARPARARCPRAGSRGCPTFPASARRRRARARARASTGSPATMPELVGGSADLAPLDEHADRGRRLDRPPRVLGPELPLRHPRARDGRDHERHRRARRLCASSARRSCSSPTTCVPRCGSPRCRGSRRSTSGRTTRSVSARTARRTSRSSTTPRCARSRTCASYGRATRSRRSRRGGSRSRARTGRRRSR